MSRTTKYDGETGRDFLPPSSQLVKKEKTVKVTLALTEDSVDFFKRQAARECAPYQRMLRGLIDIDAKRHETTT